MSRDRVGTEPPDRVGRPDEELARLASEGERNAVGELLAAYGDDLYRVCVALAGERGGKELLERTLNRAASEIRSGTRGLPVAPWLFTLAYEEARASGPPPTEARAHGARGRLQGLSRTEAAALVMRESPGIAYGMIGEVLHISSEQARDLIADARAAVIGAFARPTPECEVVQKALLRDDLPPLGRQAVERHLERCRYCRRARRGVATLPGLLQRVLPRLAPMVLFAMINTALAHASVGGGGDGGGHSGDGRGHRAARDAYRRRRSIAAGAVLGLLVVVTALAVSTGRLRPDAGPGPSAAPFVLPPAFFHLARRDVKPAGGNVQPFRCTAANCPPPLPGPVPVPPSCTGSSCKPPPCTGPRCKPNPKPRRCPAGTIVPDCKRPPRRCPAGTIEPHCKLPPRTCPVGTIEPDCKPPPDRCPAGTIEPDCHAPPSPCPAGTVEPDCHVPRPPCPDGTVEPDCHVPRAPCPPGTVEPDCHVPVPPPPPDCHGHHCGHDLQPLPELCDPPRHHHDHHEPRRSADTAPAPAPAPGAAPPSQEAAQPAKPDPQPQPQPEQPPKPDPQPQPDGPASPPPEQPQPEAPQPPEPPATEPQPQEPQQRQPDHGHGRPPGRHHDDGGVQAQWAVESRSRNRTRRFSVILP